MPTLMVSVSGIRGIIGDGLFPETIVKYTSAYSEFSGKGKIIVGQDARISGTMVKNIVIGTLLAKGNDVIDIGICPTPTVLFNVKKHNAVGGIEISASHNPNQWNALKLINKDGEFMTPEQNKEMINLLNKPGNQYAEWDSLGKHLFDEKGVTDHLDSVLAMDFLDIEKIRQRKFKVLLDCVNGAGSYIMPEMLERLGCEVVLSDCEKNGIFPRLPEPLPENLTKAMQAVKDNNTDIGIIVDPDVDRLVLLTDKGEPFSEENTIVQSVKFILGKTKGNVVVNLSTTRGVDDAAKQFDCNVFRSPVGEANVVKLMKEVNAVIGGEGSGGVIYPEVVFGRDALTGTAITLQHLLEFGGTMTELKESLPQYKIVKKKIELGNNSPDKIIAKLTEKYQDEKINTDDGLRIDFDYHWVHFRKSNTEPIIRCITEAATEELANNFMNSYFAEMKSLME